MNAQINTITRALVPDDDRLNFLPDRVGVRRMIRFESCVYDHLGTMTGGQYSGGYWHFYTLSNGGWYMAPRANVRYTLDVASNGYRGTMSADAAGIVVSLCCINALLWAVHETDAALGEKLQTAFYALREYAAEHAEAGEIFGAID